MKRHPADGEMPQAELDLLTPDDVCTPLKISKSWLYDTAEAAKCRCEGCRQWAADYGRDRKRQRTGRTQREWSAARRRDPTEYVGDNTWGRIWKQAVEEADLPFRYTPYQVRHTHASWLIDKGVDIEKVRHRLGHGDLTTTTRYVNSQELHQTGEKPQVA